MNPGRPGREGRQLGRVDSPFGLGQRIEGVREPRFRGPSAGGAAVEAIPSRVEVNDFDLRPARDLGLAPLERLRSVRRESGPGPHRLPLRLGPGHPHYFKLWHALAVHGRHHLPAEPPFVLCANHASHLDALALAAPLPVGLRDRVFSLAAGDVFFESAVPTAFAAGFVNALACGAGAAPAGTSGAAEKLVETPCGFILFPEGPEPGREVPAFKSGIGMLVAGTDVPVVPCHLSGTLDALPADCKVPRRRRIAMRVGEPVRFADVPNEHDGWQHVAATVEAQDSRSGGRTDGASRGQGANPGRAPVGGSGGRRRSRGRDMSRPRAPTGRRDPADADRHRQLVAGK